MIGTLRRLVTCVFGELSWRPPVWLSYSSRATTRLVRAHQLLSATMALMILLASAGGWWAYREYQRRPKPVTIAVEVEAPGVTPLAKELKPGPLLITFGTSVAKLEDISAKALAGGVHLEPPLEGSWRWVGDRTLRFVPSADWPAETKYRVVLDKTLFPPHVLLATYELEMTTPAFRASMPKLEFYTDPKDPAIKQVVATLEFTHSVMPSELEKKLAVAMLGEAPVFDAQQPRVAVTYGPHNRVAYLRTSSLTLPDQEDFMRVTLAQGLQPAVGNAQLKEDVERKIRIPDLYSFFKVESLDGVIVHTDEGDPEQVLLMQTSTAAKSEDILKALHVYLLPKKPEDRDAADSDADEKRKEKPGMWKSAEEIDNAVLQNATRVPVKLVPAKEENSTAHTFKIALETEGQLYVSVDKGVHALGGFALGDDYSKLLPVPELPQDITIQGRGGVLALNGERKLSIKSRGVEAIEYEIARVPAEQINHLVSQTDGEFQNPEFNSSSFGEENLARIYTEKQSINVESRFKANYSVFDFSRHLAAVGEDGHALQGLFFLKASAWHTPKEAADSSAEDATDGDDTEEDAEDSESNEHQAGASDRRFVLVTDLGMVVKVNADGSRDVFISSVKTGGPVGDVAVEVLAKNGTTLLQGKTDPTGRVTFASRGKLEREKRPVAFVARLGNDVAFMPYARADRKLDFSRFDIDGITSKADTELSAFVFTERGIYRPGDEIRIGIIAKQRDWQGQLAGLPLDVEITDSAGTSVEKRQIVLSPSGFAESVYQTTYASRSGAYDIQVSLAREGKETLLLGSASVNVKEFLPDRMKIEARLSKDGKRGWISPDDVQAAVTLRNLYGTPAANRTIKAHLELSPAQFAFQEYPGYTFFDRVSADAKRPPSFDNVDLGEQTTNDEGAVTYALQLERFAEATYRATFHTEGFEAGGGRSVATHQSVLVSPLPYVIGVKADGDTSYVPVGSERALMWKAVGPTLDALAVNDLEARLTERTFVSVLTKEENGNWAYESVPKVSVVKSEKLSISPDGLKYALPTNTAGDFLLELRDAQGTCVGMASFTVVGLGNVTRALDKSAELQVKLSRPEYNAGDDIEVSIVAPYTGTGLITIERERVFTHTWFKADQTSSIQRIHLPEGFEGTGYINVCFVRGLDSKEVFMSPLSYAAVPFRANVEKRRLPITLRTAEKAKPGETFTIGYKTDRPAKIVLFAVDQGILQVSDYKCPDPLAYAFRKAALLVGTSQIVDLIMPEFSILRTASAYGGDAEKRLNPFKRVTEKPVVFWSGIVDADSTERVVNYHVPDYFSGTLTVMAVAVSPDAVGSAERSSLIRGPFVITPSVPTVAAPGDQFDISISVANGVEGSGENAQVALTVTPSEHLEVIKSPEQPLRVSEGREATATYTVRALEKLGSASLDYTASLGSEVATLHSTLSVRPPTALMTSVRGGNFAKAGVEIPIERSLRPEFRQVEATLASIPLGLARGLDAYLQSYPNGCSEQVTSAAFTRLMLSTEADFGLTRAAVNAQLERTFSILRSRQNDQGSFGYWATDDNKGIDFISVYVMQFLIEAKDAGFAPPANVLESGLRHLQQIVRQEPDSLNSSREVAYAIYLLTREGVVTTNYLINLRDYMDKNFAKRWRGDLAAVYMAGAYALLKQNAEAQRLIDGYKLGVHDAEETWDFHSPLGADAQYIAMVGRHFPKVLDRITPEAFQQILSPIGKGQFTTLSAAYSVLALKAYSKHVAAGAPELAMAELNRDKSEKALPAQGSPTLKRAEISPNAASLRFSAKNQTNGFGAFYQVIETGYDRTLPAAAVADGLEVFREYLDRDGNVTSRARVGEPLTVRLRVRSMKPTETENIAVVDLLPGGFEIAADSIQPGAGVAGWDFVETREDRVVFFGTVGSTMREVTYRIRPTNRGEFVVPPVFAEAMYDRGIKAHGLAGHISAVDR